MTSIKGFQRVASAFDATEVSLAVTLLEGAGYLVLTPGLALHQMIPHYGFAFGPVPILVPAGDAGDARALLLASQTGAIGSSEAPSEASETNIATSSQNRSVWSKVLDFLFYFFAGISHPRDRLSVNDGPANMAARDGFGVRMSAPNPDE